MNKPKALPELHPSDVARFWSSVEVGPPAQCWPWKLAKLPGGYGQFRVLNRTVKAHRLAYFLFHGEDPGERFVCHTCDNPPCCNGAHLYAGTAKENAADCAARGRHNPPSGKRSGRYTKPERTARGERVGGAKLTAAMVTRMREMYASGAYTQTELAKRFGIKRETAGRVLRGESWQHVEQPAFGLRNLRELAQQHRGKPGEQNTQAKLTAKQVQEMRQRYESESTSYRLLAKEYGVSVRTVADIIKRKSWTNL